MIKSGQFCNNDETSDDARFNKQDLNISWESQLSDSEFYLSKKLSRLLSLNKYRLNKKIHIEHIDRIDDDMLGFLKKLE